MLAERLPNSVLNYFSGVSFAKRKRDGAIRPNQEIAVRLEKNAFAIVKNCTDQQPPQRSCGIPATLCWAKMAVNLSEGFRFPGHFSQRSPFNSCNELAHSFVVNVNRLQIMRWVVLKAFASHAGLIYSITQKIPIRLYYQKLHNYVA